MVDHSIQFILISIELQQQINIFWEGVRLSGVSEKHTVTHITPMKGMKLFNHFAATVSNETQQTKPQWNFGQFIFANETTNVTLVGMIEYGNIYPIIQ